MRTIGNPRSLLPIAAFLFWSLVSNGETRAHEVPPSDDFKDVVKPWITAIRSGDTAKLGSLTALPFTYSATTRNSECVGMVRTISELESWGACVRRTQAQLFAKIETGSDVAVRTGGWGESKHFKALARKISRDGTWVQAYLQNARGEDYSFRFLISGVPFRVRAFVLSAEPERHQRTTHNRALQQTGLAPRR